LNWPEFEGKGKIICAHPVTNTNEVKWQSGISGRAPEKQPCLEIPILGRGT
jgi:hypothetical protein